MTNAEHAEFTRLMESAFTPDETAVMEFIAKQTIAYLQKSGETSLVSLAKVRPTHGGYPNA